MGGTRDDSNELAEFDTSSSLGAAEDENLILSQGGRPAKSATYLGLPKLRGPATVAGSSSKTGGGGLTNP